MATSGLQAAVDDIRRHLAPAAEIYVLAPSRAPSPNTDNAEWDGCSFKTWSDSSDAGDVLTPSSSRSSSSQASFFQVSSAVGGVGASRPAPSPQRRYEKAGATTAECRECRARKSSIFWVSKPALLFWKWISSLFEWERIRSLPLPPHTCGEAGSGIASDEDGDENDTDDGDGDDDDNGGDGGDGDGNGDYKEVCVR